MKNLKLRIFSVFMLLLAAPLAVQAYSVAYNDALYVAKDQTIEGNYYAGGQSINIDGHVTGDVFCAGQSISINGIVDGDVICVGQNINVSGKIGGSVRVAGSDINVRGTVARGLDAVGANINIEKDARIAWDAVIGGANVQMRGNVGRSLLGGGANVILDGTVEKDANFYLSRNDGKQAILTLTDSAVINGNLMYKSVANASISPKAQIKGQTTHSLPTISPRNERYSGSQYLSSFIIGLLSALVFGFALMLVWKNAVVEVADGMSNKFWPAVGWGALWIIAVPIVALILALTIIGWRLAFIIMGIWFLVMMVSKILVGIAVGRMLLKKYWVAQKESLNWAVAIGITASWIVFYIPFLGWVASIIATWWGAGTIVTNMMKLRNKVNSPNTLL